MKLKIKNWFKNLLTSSDSSQELSKFSAYREYMSLGSKGPICRAPWTSMSFNIDGTVTACCLNRKTSVSIVDKTIKEVWDSNAFNELRNHVEQEDLCWDCMVCLNDLNNQAFDTLKAKDYDKYNADNTYPKVMEFCLDNTCNLACTMCNSVLSSSIRKEKGLEPTKSLYGASFAEELKEFIPNLEEAIFAGGEPFLIPLYYDIWESMLLLNPSIKISIVSNGTVLNSKIKDLLSRGNFNINLSIDSFDKENYEKIRRNANFEKLMKNLEWFSAYAEENNFIINIPICPIITNWSTIPDSIRFINAKNLRANFVFVERPFSLSLLHASSEVLEKIEQNYSSQSFEITGGTSNHNIQKFNDLIKNIANWKERNLLRKEGHPNFQKELNNWVDSFDNQNDNRIKEIVQTIKKIILALDSDNKDRVIDMLSQLSSDRLSELFKNKSDEEIRIVFKELIG